MLLVTGIASLLVLRSFSSRVDHLQEFSRRVAEGDFRPLFADRAGDALDKMAVSLSETAARLDLTIRTLRDERNLSAAILGSLVEGVAVVDAPDRVFFSNPGFSEILGLDMLPQIRSVLLDSAQHTALM